LAFIERSNLGIPCIGLQHLRPEHRRPDMALWACRAVPGGGKSQA